jgi:hypothetical protein
MNGYNFSFATILLAALAGLIYLANLGSMAAIVTLAILLTILLIGLGAGIAWLSINLMGRQEERRFRDNVSENIGIMKQMQSLQNAQNQTLMSQLSTVAKLPAPAPGVDLSTALDITDGVFSELGD